MSPEPVAKRPPTGEGATEMTEIVVSMDSRFLLTALNLPEFLWPWSMS
jgi:hypothetical protein